MRFRSFVQSGRPSARLVAALTLCIAASWALACRDAVEAPRADTVETPPGASEISTETDSLRFTGSSGLGRTRTRPEPARSPVGEARGAGAPPQTAGPPSMDSDAYVALDPDSEAKASETANNASRLEIRSSADSMGRSAVDSDAYALSRE